MRPKFAAMLAPLLFACSARADLDLTPVAGGELRDKMSVAYTVFHDGAKDITYVPPAGWSISGSRQRATLAVPNHSQTVVSIQTAARLRVPALDENAVKSFGKNPALLSVPKGAQGVKITAIALNPLVIDSHPTLEIEMTYHFYGQTCARSLFLVDRNGSEVSFTLDCPAPDFNMLESAFRRSLYSISNL